MPKFSEISGSNKNQAQLDFVDIDTDRDLPLFLDPFVFSQKNDDWSTRCHNDIVSFFGTVLEDIRTNNEVHALHLLDHLHEPNETCLGMSRARPSGRGVGWGQAGQLYARLAGSRAAQTGLLSDLSECELFIPGIGPDKISDITTNIVRKHLIDYTQEQCRLLGVEMQEGVPSGWVWDSNQLTWTEEFVELPVINRRKLLLVPKASVRWRLGFSHQEYYNQFVLTFLQAQHLNQNTALVQTLKSGEKRVYKNRLIEIHPLAKDFLAEFSEEHPEVLERYKRMIGVPHPIKDSELELDFDESIFAAALRETLNDIDRGNKDAERYHQFMVGALEFIFYPHLMYPIKEHEIHQGRKRIDITYTNNSDGGFFFRRRSAEMTAAVNVVVECKNYMQEVANPELDQISGRFSPRRGRLGFLMCRSLDNRERFIERCRDTAIDNRGFIIAFEDNDVVRMLHKIEEGNRLGIDQFLETRFQELIA